MPVIQVVLRRDPQTGQLVQNPLSQAEKDQIDERIKNIRDNYTDNLAQLYKALAHAAQNHPGQTHPLIVLSRSAADEIEWIVGEHGFTVSVQAVDGGPDNPLDGFPKNDGGTGVVRSGIPAGTADHHHYTFTVRPDRGAAFDPDWYTGP